MYPPLAAPAAGCDRSILVLRAALSVLRRRAWLAAGCFIATSLLVACAWWSWPRRYASEAKLLTPRRPPEALARGGFAHDAVPAAPPTSAGRSGAGGLDPQLWNEATLERVAAAVGDKLILSEGGAWGWRRFAVADRSAGPTDARNRAALTVKALLAGLHVAPAASADVMELTYVAGTPETAQRTLQQLLEAACSVPAASHEAANAERLAAEPAHQARESSSSKTARPEIGSPSQTPGGDRQQELHTRLATADDAHREIDGQLAAVRARLGELTVWRERLSAQGKSPQLSRIEQSAIERLRAQWNELQAADAGLAARMTAIHPARVSLRMQRARLEERLNQLTQAEPTSPSAFDSVQRNLELALWSEEAHRAGLESQAADLAAQRTELVRQIAALAVPRRELSQSAAEPTASTPTWLAPPEVHAAPLRILQPATKSDRPIAPRPDAWLAAGLALATFSAIAAVAFAERRNPSFSRPEQISRRLGLPVLATVPRVQRNSA